MIKRIVKMQFRTAATEEFISVFENARDRIRQFPGCHHLELWRDKNQPDNFFTYSFWDDEAALDRYRHSELFKATWAKTKPLFVERAQAWSVEMIDMGLRPEAY